MDYTTTKLRPTRTYPTYQFYALTDAKELSAPDVFHICILETMRWLRARLSGFDDLPAEIMLPEPEDFRSLDAEMLQSFTYTRGMAVDVVYAEKRGSWAFRITESDIGANHGKPNERPPVIGRTFQTDVAFKIDGNCVEVGVRTLCSDPYECKVPCEVFRPTLVKAIASSADLGVQRGGFRLDGKPFRLDSKAAAEHFTAMFEDPAFDLPLVLIAESGFEEIAPVLPDLNAPKDMLAATKGFGLGDVHKEFKLDLSKANLKTTAPKFADKPVKNAPKPTLAAPPKKERRKRMEFDTEKLAGTLLGFAVVVHVSEKCFPLLKNKCGIQISSGDIMVCCRGEETERHPYKAWSRDAEDFFRTFRDAMRQSPKRSDYQFGGVEFVSKARLRELSERRHETVDLTEKCEIYRQEKDELRRQVTELSQQNSDLRLSGENLRTTQKKLLSLQDELTAAENRIRALRKQQDEREEAYRRSAALVAFYREKADIAAEFPTVKDKICDWAEERFAQELVITPDARTALRKYETAFDLAILCDGLLYLSAYAKYRRGDLDADTLELYAERYGWEVQFCGKEALKMHREDYTVTIDGEESLLNQHIKYGVSAQSLVRVYFCWDDPRGKLIVGYMPGHLATKKKGT